MNTELADAAGRRYVEAIGRNPGEEKQHSHLYDVTADYLPMCIYGWNRSGGSAISIFRGHSGAKGLCRICEKRANAGLPPIAESRHKTKWL